MINKQILKRLENFDAELCKLLKENLERQYTMLSLIPTDSAASPFSTYLKGSVLGNDFVGHFSAEHYSQMEILAAKRACELFKAEHAIVRTGNLAAASRVVLQAFAKPDDTIMSFNLRKQEHCSGNQMQYFFVKFALEPEKFNLNFDKFRALALLCQPKIIIYSPVNYPKNIDYKKIRKVADDVKAVLWVDMGQNAGLVAAGEIDSPVPFADVVTFAASDALHGPQSGIILSKNKFADLLEKTVVETGHASLKKNVLAALAITFREAACEEYKDYAKQVISNAHALEKGLKKAGAELICSPTENHLVLVRLKNFQNAENIVEKLAQGRLLVKKETLMTVKKNISYPILRLSSLDPTTRGLYEDDMFTVGLALGEFLKSPQDSNSIKSVEKIIKELVEGLPIFSDEWLPSDEIVKEIDSDLMMKAMIYGTV
ncbi:MAG: serine hydroxymethyltransferase [Selenomonadaceae bacterium]|nr:serine hydroxymethyltransferase [Selenomonadaceae bacterium]